MPSILHFVICTLRTRWRQLSADNSFTEDTSSLSCILELFQSTLISRRCRPERRRTWSERWAGGVLLRTLAFCSTFRYNFFLCLSFCLWLCFLENLYFHQRPHLGKPSREKSAVFLNIVQTGGGVKPCSKIMSEIVVCSGGHLTT